MGDPLITRGALCWEVLPRSVSAYILFSKDFVNGSKDIMAYCRGSKDDWDRWASVTGDEGWSWESIQPYMLKVTSAANARGS